MVLFSSRSLPAAVQRFQDLSRTEGHGFHVERDVRGRSIDAIKRLTGGAYIASALLFGIPAVAGGQQGGAGQSTPGAGPVAVGQVQVTADSSRYVSGALIYTNAHLKAQNGMSLDADEIKILTAGMGAGSPDLTATGHVRAYGEQIDEGRTYTLTAQKAAYDRKAGRVDLSGGVELSITSAYTAGPLIQRGDTAVILLGKKPDYPQIVMNRVHTVFTPLQ